MTGLRDELALGHGLIGHGGLAAAEPSDAAEEKMGELNFVFLKDFKSASKNYSKLEKFLPKLQNHDFYEYRLALSLLRMKDFYEAEKVFLKMIRPQKHIYRVKSFYHLGLLNFEREE